MTTRFLSKIAALAAPVTLGANLISGGSAQAAIFDYQSWGSLHNPPKRYIPERDMRVSRQE